MARAIRKKSGTAVETNWRFVWSCSEIDKMITRTDPMILDRRGSKYFFEYYRELYKTSNKIVVNEKTAGAKGPKLV